MANLKDYALCRRGLLAPRGFHLGVRCLHFDILGDHFGISGAPWGAILTPRDHAGGPWEQQDGLEMVVHKILFDLGVIFKPVYIRFSRSRSLTNRFCFRACLQLICFIDF